MKRGTDHNETKNHELLLKDKKVNFKIVKCPCCDCEKYTIIKSSEVNNTMTTNEYLGVYSSSSNHKLLEGLVQCKDCDVIYVNPRVEDNIIVQSYTDAQDHVFIEQNKQRINTFKNKLKYLEYKYNISPSKYKKVLDIGCAGGAFPKAASDLGYSVIGVELSRWLAQKGKELYKLDIREGALKDQNFENLYFDIVCLWDVIEHLTDPKDMLVEINQLLSDDGFLIINYPDYGSWARILMGNKWPMFLSVHLIYFDKETITKFLYQNGFEVIDAMPYWQSLKLGYILQRASEYFSIFKIINVVIHFLKLNNMPLTYNIGQTLVVARKIG